jgi:hypothetical protein
VFQVPSSIVSVVPVVTEPKIVGRPVFDGAVAAAKISNDLVTELAATKDPLPAALAVIVHVPVETFVTVEPETVHFPAVLEEKVTARPELDDAVNSNVPEAPT